MKNDKELLTDVLFDWAYVPGWSYMINNLADMAEKEDWQYVNNPSDYSDYPILENYVKYTFKRVSKERKIAFDKTDSYCCFNTGLVTDMQDPIYIQFKENIGEGTQFWMYNKLFSQSMPDAVQYSKLPEIASYFDDPTKLIYDYRKELIVNYPHIVSERKERFPNVCSGFTDYQLQSLLAGCIKVTQDRVRRNYKIAIPQYYQENLQLLLPICLENPKKADLALVVQDFGTIYRASTCLTLEMAKNNARLISKPDKEWLNP